MSVAGAAAGAANLHSQSKAIAIQLLYMSCAGSLRTVHVCQSCVRTQLSVRVLHNNNNLTTPECNMDPNNSEPWQDKAKVGHDKSTDSI